MGRYDKYKKVEKKTSLRKKVSTIAMWIMIAMAVAMVIVRIVIYAGK